MLVIGRQKVFAHPAENNAARSRTAKAFRSGPLTPPDRANVIAAGLLLPPLTGIAPRLAIAAAVGLLLIQIDGITVHLRRGETRQIELNIAPLAAAAATAWLGTVWL